MYEDIIEQSRPVSQYRKSSRLERAAQFSPFAALKGYETCIQNEERYVESKKILSEEQKSELNLSLNQLKKGDLVRLEFFEEDQYKEGGSYKRREGVIQKIDNVSLIVYFEKDWFVKMDCIYLLERMES